MQAYEHIMATMIKLSKNTRNLNALTLEENLELILLIQIASEL